MKTHHCLIVISLAALLAAGCRGTGPAAGPVSSGKADRSRLSEEERMNLEYFFFNANKEKILGNNDKAMDLFAQCIRIDNRNAASMYELAALYAEQKKFNDALFFAASAVEIDPSNTWYRLLLADLYRQAGKFDESLAEYERLAKDNPDRIDYYFNWANALLYAGRIEEAVGVFDRIEEKSGVDRDLSIQKERIYLKLGKVDKAAMEIEKLIASNPDDMQSWSLLVELYQANGMKDKVYDTIERMKAINPESPNVYLALAEYYRSVGENEKSFEQLKEAFRSPRLDSDVKLRIVGSYVPLVGRDSTMMEQALVLCDILAATHPGEAMTHTAFGEFLTMDEQYADANKQYEAALAIDKSNENIWQQYIANTESLSDYNTMLDATTQAMELFPNNPLYYLYNGLAQINLGHDDLAVQVLTSGAKLVVDNDGLLADFYSKLGDSYHELGNNEESDKHYEKAIGYYEKGPRAGNSLAYTLNNYSYYLSLRKEKLDKAASMSKRSNELVPGQASFEDTYGWILYQQGKYADARTWLDKALSHGGDGNGTILEHYGDVLFRLGEKDLALEYWLKAKAAGETSDLIDRKIAEKNLVE